MGVTSTPASTLCLSVLLRFGLSCGISCAVVLRDGLVSSPTVSSPMHVAMARGCTLRPIESACRQAAPTSRWQHRKYTLTRLMTSLHGMYAFGPTSTTQPFAELMAVGLRELAGVVPFRRKHTH